MNVALVTVIGSVVSSLITWIFTRKKNRIDLLLVQIEANKKQLEFYINLVDNQSRHIKEYMKKSDELLDKSDLLEREISRLKNVINKLVNDVCLEKNCTKKIYMSNSEVETIINGGI